MVLCIAYGGRYIRNIKKSLWRLYMLLPSTYLSDTSHMTERSFPNRQNRPAAAAASQPVDPYRSIYFFFFECLLKLISIIYLPLLARESWSLSALTLMWMKENPLLYRSIYLSIYQKAFLYCWMAGCFIRQYMHDGVVVFWDTHKYSWVLLVRVVMHDSSCCSCFFFISPFEALVKLLLWWAQAQSQS